VPVGDGQQCSMGFEKSEGRSQKAEGRREELQNGTAALSLQLVVHPL
jgi:hypothetical protein